MTRDVRCPSCATELPTGSRFCLSCGHAVGDPSQMSTAMFAGVGAVAAGVGRLVSSDSVPVGGLTPGTVFATRYRIIGLLGRGGMGEVYRADDLKLGQPVALKFLPAALSSDAVRRERFFAEVRITRQLAHPNICRVYDIAEENGQHFLSMEFIDGEDLASLLKRIGYLPNEKALDIARQLLAGLAAAHERGVLHRDLKPSNIMIDGHGRVRLTDFGLAIATTDEEQPVGDVSGTPAYMAPEQLAGKGATVRSDIYSLGLVLYEILSGKRAFTAPTLAALREEKEQSTPTAPSELRSGVDPIVERLVMRCLERDPRSRPASVAQLAAALPGGDPLAAALAAGETPSPELVAASGLKEGLRPAVAIALLAFVVAGSLIAVAMNRRTMLIQRVAPGKPPEVLVERAREIIKKAGYIEPPADSAFGFMYDADLVNYLDNTDRSTHRWNTLQALNPVTFWYRQSPRPLVRDSFVGWSTVTAIDPPFQFSGEVSVELDPQGQLKRFDAIPSRIRSAAPADPFDWTIFFSQTGFKASAWTPSEPRSNPTTFADTQRAWTGTLAASTSFPVQMEAAAYGGRPVTFHIVGPWTPDEPADRALLASTSFRVIVWVLIILALAFMIGSVFYARRNLRLGRGDRRGALRIMIVGQGTGMLGWALIEHHVAAPGEFGRLIAALGNTLYVAGLVGVIYISLEPFVRRRWPQVLVSWARVLLGTWRDPLVGRDVLIGCAAGVAATCLIGLETSVPSWFGYPEGPLVASTINALLGPLSFVNTLQQTLWVGVFVGLIGIFMLFFLQMILRSDWAALVVWVAVQTLGALTIFQSVTSTSDPPFFTSAGTIAIVGPIAVLMSLLFYSVLKRFGLVAFMATLVVQRVFAIFPMTFQTSAWYAGYGYVALALVGATALFGFRTSLGGRPLLVGAMDD